MNRLGLLNALGIACFAVTVSGCMELDGPTPAEGADLAAESSAIGVCRPSDPTCGCDDINDPLLCGFQNGADGWFNFFQRSLQNGWQKAWRNDWESPGQFTNGYAVAWSQTWGSYWRLWNFSDAGAPRYAWAYGNSNYNGCGHPITQTGGRLASGCNDIVTSVCNSPGMQSCCTGEWSASCVARAVSIGSSGGSSHSVLVTGAGLNAEDLSSLPASSGKMTPTAGLVFGGGGGPRADLGPNLCARKICQITATNGTHPYGHCCSTSDPTGWDATCVDLAVSMCSARYLAHTRIEDNRVYTDACVEPKVAGFACPVAYTQQNGGQECCRRALVLRGTYQAIDTSTAYPPSDYRYRTGTTIDWRLSSNVRLGFGPLAPTVDVTATLAPDNCWTGTDGVHYCDTPKQKLYQVAGGNGPLYPDCRDANQNPHDHRSPCGCPASATADMHERCTDATHDYLGYRRLLMATVSALLTTDLHHEVDIKWMKRDGEPADTTITPFDSVDPPWFTNVFDLSTWEGNWGTYPESADHLVTKAACYGRNSPQRAHGNKVDNVPDCVPYLPFGQIQTSFYVEPVLHQ